MKINFKNKKILITGASQGLGKILINKYLKCDARVISVSRKNEKSLNHKNFVNIKLNLNKKNSEQNLIKKLKKLKLLPDIIINNIGGDLNIKNPLIDYNNFEKVLRLNFGISINLINKLVPNMKKNNWGRICFVSSISGYENHGTPAYCSSKAAINAYIRSIGRLLIKDNIIVTGVSPGAFEYDGGYWDRIKKNNKKHYKSFMNRVSRKKIAKVDEIASIVMFMTSEYTSNCAGTNFLVDGGQGRFFHNGI